MERMNPNASATPESVLDALREVIDPELDISIVDLGLVRGIEVQEDTGRVKVTMTLTSPTCPLGPEIVAATRSAANRTVGVSDTQVELVWSPLWDPHQDATEDGKALLGIWD
jgi:metal-sulfur cluster biosynthetic enzyme